jgi:putative membrane protein
MPDAPAPPSPEKDPRVYFAAERTLLAWIRTGLALMGFGFAIARFGLFLRQMQAAQTSLPVHSSWGSPLTGVVLIALGVLVNLTGSFQYASTIRQLSEGSWIPGRVSRTGIALAILLAILGALMAAYLLYLH